ncbi:DUF3489 domain-containing protein [Rhodobacteraceae bacterium D3-12]|nr:DUF3489 domain-containing protein [Rhodobacteraceae bacterium D3-12]
MTKSDEHNAPAKAMAASLTTKKDQLIKLLGTRAGADTKTLSAKLVWQQHTTRAALTGLRKAGYEIACNKPTKGGMSRHRILSAPTPNKSRGSESAANGA